MAETFHLEILTPTKKMFSGDVVSLGVVSSRGKIEVLPGHAQMISVLGIGVAHLEFPGNYGFGMAIHGGIMNVQPGREDEDPDRVEILAQEGEHPEEIDIERAERAKERAAEALRVAAAEAEVSDRVLQDRLRAEARIGAFRSFRKKPDELED